MASLARQVWYGHAGTVTVMMTVLPDDWQPVPPERLYRARGWTFFERQVSSLAKVGVHVLDAGLFAGHCAQASRLEPTD